MSHISYIQYKTIKEMEDYKQTLYNDELLNILPDGVIIFVFRISKQPKITRNIQA